MALHDGRREQPAVHTVAQPQAAARLQAVLDVIDQQKLRWSLPAGTPVVVSYEAGQDAFWICRALQARGITCHVVDPASIPVERHKRRAKTDRLDVIKLVINLRAWLRGERDRMHVVHAPSPQDEASRHLMRDRAELQKEVLQHRDRMRKLLATLGCWDEVDHRHFPAWLARDEVKCHDGASLPPELRERLLRECERLALAQRFHRSIRPSISHLNQQFRLRCGGFLANPGHPSQKPRQTALVELIGYPLQIHSGMLLMCHG